MAARTRRHLRTQPPVGHLEDGDRLDGLIADGRTTLRASQRMSSPSAA